MEDTDRGVPVTMMRGGTSRALFFEAEHLPPPGDDRDRFLKRAVGSPHPLQVDGLGGGHLLTSKVAIVSRSTTTDVDVEYTFVQVGVDDDFVRYSENCGNISAAVGLHAVEHNWVPVAEKPGVTAVRVHNTNTDGHLVITVPTDGRAVETTGDFVVDPRVEPGPEIRIDFAKTVGSTTPGLLPTGAVTDVLHVPSLGRDVTVSIIDIAKLTVFFDAADIAVDGRATSYSPEELERFWAVRSAAAQLVEQRTGQPCALAPTPVAVSAPPEGSGDGVSIVARRVFGPPPVLHPSFAVTGGIATATAVHLPDSVVATRAAHLGEEVTIAHPSGTMRVNARVDGHTVVEASLSRSARLIMDGRLYI